MKIITVSPFRERRGLDWRKIWVLILSHSLLWTLLISHKHLTDTAEHFRTEFKYMCAANYQQQQKAFETLYLTILKTLFYSEFITCNCDLYFHHVIKKLDFCFIEIFCLSYFLTSQLWVYISHFKKNKILIWLINSQLEFNLQGNIKTVLWFYLTKNI